VSGPEDPHGVRRADAAAVAVRGRIPFIPSTSLAGKVALITGSSRGIGRGCALAMAAAGADVVVNYHAHRDDGEETARQVQALGRRSVAVHADISEREDVAALVRVAVETFGHLDVVVANAYRSIRKPFLELLPEEFESTLRVSLFGTFHTCQLAAQQMVRQANGGKIIVISSVLAERALATSAPYNTAKAGINHLVRTVANELARYRINVNAIEPGWIDTPGERLYASEEEIAQGGEKLPWGRLGTPEEMGAVAAFLASDAAAYVSGSIIRADGAYLAALGDF
jgi:glucose 1-dehydrogenase